MEKVQKKTGKKRPRHRVLWVAAAFCVLLLSVAALARMQREAEKPEVPEKQETGGTLMQEAPDEILRVTVAMKDREAWTMERGAEGQFQLTGEVDWLVDELMSDRVTDALAYLEYADILTEDTEEYAGRLAEFGLEVPAVRVEWESATSGEHALRIGDAIHPGESDAYFMLVEGDTRLYAVEAGTLQDLAVDRALLHAVPDLPILRALLDEITVRDAEGEVLEGWKLMGRITNQDAGVNWRMTGPVSYAADEELMKNLLENAGNLGLGAYVGEATAENLADCGLEVPGQLLAFHMAAGSTGTVTESGVYDVTDWEEKTVTLRIGGDRDEMTVYVQYEDAIYTMTAFSLTPFLETDPMTMAARYPVLTPLASLTEMTIENAGGEMARYEITREETAEDGQTAHCLKNGEEIAWEAFEAAYNRLLVVTVSGTLPRGATWGEAHTKYTFRTVSGGTHTVVLSDFDGIHDAVTLDGDTLFYLIHGGMTEMP